jgi:hypothetical protein
MYPHWVEPEPQIMGFHNEYDKVEGCQAAFRTIRKIKTLLMWSVIKQQFTVSDVLPMWMKESEYICMTVCMCVHCA